MLMPWQTQCETWLKKPEYAGRKIIFCFIMSLLPFFTRQLIVFLSLDAMFLLLLALAGVNTQRLLKIILFAFLSAAVIFLSHVLQHHFLQGCLVFFQFLFMIFLSALLVLTTTEMDLVYAIEIFLQKLKVPVRYIDNIGLFCFLTLRSIHILSLQYKEIRMAQKARGLDKHVFAIIIPLLMKMFHAADGVSEALVSKGIDLS